MRVPGILAEIIAWYRANVPDPTGWIEFRPGLTEEALDEFQRKVGKPFPPDLMELYRFGDGMSQGWLLYGIPELRSMADVIQSSDETSAYLSQFENFALNSDQTIIRGVKRESWRPGWLPIADNSGDYTIIDLDPADGGTYGQVLSYGHEIGGVTELLATGLQSMFETWLEELHEGKHEWSETSGQVFPIAWREQFLREQEEMIRAYGCSSAQELQEKTLKELSDAGILDLIQQNLRLTQELSRYLEQHPDGADE